MRPHLLYQSLHTRLNIHISNSRTTLTSLYPHMTLFAFCIIRWFRPFVTRDSAWVFVYGCTCEIQNLCVARQPAEGITGPVPPGDGPLQPVLRALILLGNHFPPTGSSLVNSFQSWLTQGRAMFPPRSGQHLLRSSIIIWHLISARNPLLPPLAFRSHMQWPLARLALNMLLFPNFPPCLFSHYCSLMCCGKVFLCLFGTVSHPSAFCKSNFKVMTVGLDDSPDFRGHLLFLMALVHPACPGMQKEKEKKVRK